jgi:hypothetical protein
VVDLQILVQTLREKLPDIQGKSHITAQELDEAVLLVDTLTQAIGTKEHSPQVREQTVSIRAKALRMVTNAWDEIRSATAAGGKHLQWFETEIRDAHHDVVARIRKRIYVRRKPAR